jgi:hypothetical protein
MADFFASSHLSLITMMNRAILALTKSLEPLHEVFESNKTKTNEEKLK